MLLALFGGRGRLCVEEEEEEKEEEGRDVAVDAGGRGFAGEMGLDEDEEERVGGGRVGPTVEARVFDVLATPTSQFHSNHTRCQ